MSSRPRTAAASRNTRSRSYQRTDQPRAARSGFSHALDERHGFSERKRPRSWNRRVGVLGDAHGRGSLRSHSCLNDKLGHALGLAA